MKHILRKGLQTYEIEAGLCWEDQSHSLDFFDVESAHTFLLGFMGDDYSLRALRNAVSETSARTLYRMNDCEVVRQAAHLIYAKRISIRPPTEHQDFIGTPYAKTEAEEEPPLAAAAKPVEETPVNVVTPKIEMEYKVVLLDPDLAKHQGPNETKVYADPTYIEVSVGQTNKALPFKGGGTLSYSSANVAAYLDKACQNKLPVERAPLSNAQLIGGQKMRIYFRGTGSGTFDVSLTLDDPQDASVRVEKPVENKGREKMGVVKLEMKLHQQDIEKLKKIEVDPDTDPIDTYYANLKDTDLPEQKEMTTEEKIKKGRLLHVQKEGHFGRAKLVCKKLTASQWPSGTDDYDVVLKPVRKSGAIEIYDKAWDGEPKAAPAIKVADLKRSDQVFWVQGTKPTTEMRDVGLSLGIDRPEGGLAKTVKQNGDWANFSIVDIREVKVDYTPEEGKPVKWDNTQHRFYINMGAAWDKTNKKFSTDANTDVNGRKITIGAQLSKALKDVPIHFMLAEDENNRKAANWGEDLPGTWKWKDVDKGVKHKDKSKRKDLLHLSAKTDNKGYAKVELTLSRFGGDVFWPGAYIAEDPHLAKYIRGHAELEKKAPVLAADAVTVWRKFWYQEVRVSGINVAGFGDAADTYSDVKTEMLAAPVVEMPLKTANKISPPVIFPKHMVSFYLNNARTAYVNNYPNDNGDALVVGDATETRFFSLVKPAEDKPVAIPILNAHALWVQDGLTSSDSIPWFDAASFPKKFTADKKLLDPPLQGGTLLRSGRWRAVDWDPAANEGAGGWTNDRSGNLAAGDISLDPGRSSPREVQIKKPAGIVLAAAGTQVTLTNLTFRAGTTYLGTSYDDGIVNSYTPNDEQDFINTINHEIGHSLKQVSKVCPSGIPAHPHQYDQDGSHCRYTNKSCLMYESGPQPASLNRYCPVCHHYVLVQDMSEV